MSVYKNTQGGDNMMNEIVSEGVLTGQIIRGANWCEITTVTTIMNQLNDIQYRIDNPNQLYFINLQEKIQELKEIFDEIFQE